MDGAQSDRSVRLRASQNLFEISNEHKSHSDVITSVSILEAYNENLGALIVTEIGTMRAPKWELRTNVTQESKNGVYVPNVPAVKPGNFSEIGKVMLVVSLRKSKGKTDANHHR